MAGNYEFTEQEALGFDIFRGKGMCSACHVRSASSDDGPSAFTNFTFDNIGVPKNPENPYLLANPDWFDQGLAGFLATVVTYEVYALANLGKHKVPTLRNSARNPGAGSPKAFSHNGYFKSLKSIIHFYNTRDVKPVCPDDFTTEKDALKLNCWPAAEVVETVNSDELGNLGLTDEEEDAIVAFLATLSDGFKVQKKVK